TSNGRLVDPVPAIATCRLLFSGFIAVGCAWARAVKNPSASNAVNSHLSAARYLMALPPAHQRIDGCSEPPDSASSLTRGEEPREFAAGKPEAAAFPTGIDDDGSVDGAVNAQQSRAVA